jgi:hypothetical protein
MFITLNANKKMLLFATTLGNIFTVSTALALSGGSGGGYNGPLTKTQSIPIGLQHEVTTSDLTRAIRTCLIDGDAGNGVVSMGQKLLQTLTPATAALYKPRDRRIRPYFWLPRQEQQKQNMVNSQSYQIAITPDASKSDVITALVATSKLYINDFIIPRDLSSPPDCQCTSKDLSAQFEDFRKWGKSIYRSALNKNDPNTPVLPRQKPVSLEQELIFVRLLNNLEANSHLSSHLYTTNFLFYIDHPKQNNFTLRRFSTQFGLPQVTFATIKGKVHNESSDPIYFDDENYILEDIKISLPPNYGPLVPLLDAESKNKIMIKNKAGETEYLTINMVEYVQCLKTQIQN